MNRFSLVLCVAASLALSGCTIAVAETPPSQMCNFQRYALQVALPGRAVVAPDDGAGAATVVQAIDRVYAATTSGAAPPPDDAMLFMSGGGEHGAFGAGVLDEWKREGGHLPRFRMVTGISTGSILATFAFIDQPERLVRLEQESGDRASRRSASYAIRDESALLRPIVRGGIEHLNIRSGLRLARSGAVADLDPLRQTLRQEIGDRELRLVAGHSQDSDGRLLLVGAVDVDSGQAAAFDLTHMARQYRDAQTDADRTRYRDCYVEAIIASSSAPLAAAPVFIDNRMYVDGGARFGLFSDEIGSSLDPGKGNDAAAPETQRRLDASRVYAIVNGDLTTTERCARRDPRLCDEAGVGGRYGAHAGWSLIRLADRSEQILVNQIYRMSLDRIMLLSDKQGRRSYPAWIRPDVARFSFSMDDGQLGAGELTCPEWRAMDRDLLQPIQFHPRYMHCLIGYGRQQYRDSLRWHALPASMPAPPADPIAPKP